MSAFEPLDVLSACCDVHALVAGWPLSVMTPLARLHGFTVRTSLNPIWWLRLSDCRPVTAGLELVAADCLGDIKFSTWKEGGGRPGRTKAR